MSFVRRRATTLLLVATLLSPLRSNAFIATTPRSVSTATAHGRCAHDKQPPNSPTSARKPSTRGTTRRPVSCDTGGGGSTSRKHFLQKGAVAAAWGLVAASLAPPPSLAKDVGGIDIRGIDVSEVLHMGAGESGGKATKPLRDCVLNVERVRISTQQVMVLYRSLATLCRFSQRLQVVLYEVNLEACEYEVRSLRVPYEGRCVILVSGSTCRQYASSFRREKLHRQSTWLCS